MKHRILVGICAGALAVAGGSAVWVAQTSANGATQATLTVAAPTLVQLSGSTHNGGTSSACGSPVAAVSGSEFRGTLQNGAGSYLGAVQFPQGATIKTLRVTVHDFTDPGDVHLFLVRKSALAQPVFTGKSAVIASVSSSGFVDQARQFSSSAITFGVVDNTQWAYFLELVNCDETIQPIAAQVVYTTP